MRYRYLLILSIFYLGCTTTQDKISIPPTNPLITQKIDSYSKRLIGDWYREQIYDYNRKTFVRELNVKEIISFRDTTYSWMGKENYPAKYSKGFWKISEIIDLDTISGKWVNSGNVGLETRTYNSVINYTYFIDTLTDDELRFRDKIFKKLKK